MICTPMGIEAKATGNGQQATDPPVGADAHIGPPSLARTPPHPSSGLRETPDATFPPGGRRL